jgi:hypothetical protein
MERPARKNIPHVSNIAQAFTVDVSWEKNAYSFFCESNLLLTSQSGWSSTTWRAEWHTFRYIHKSNVMNRMNQLQDLFKHDVQNLYFAEERIKEHKCLTLKKAIAAIYKRGRSLK